MQRPKEKIGLVTLEVEFCLNRSLMACYTAPRWRSKKEDELIEAIGSRGLEYGVKRSVDRIEALLGSSSAWVERYSNLSIFELGVLLLTHGYLCLMAPPWQYPCFLLLFLGSLYWIEKNENSPKVIYRANGALDGFRAPGD